MPCFGKRQKTPHSVSRSQDQDATTTAKASTSNPEEPATSPSIPAVIAALPESANGRDKDLNTDKQLDEASKAIDAANPGVRDCQDSESLQLVNAAGAAIDIAQAGATAMQSYAPTAKIVYDSDAMKVVREGVDMFVENLPGLVKALDEVAKLHPFIAVAVGAFRVVIELDLKRRDNDKKIGVLFLEMRDMMEALLQLRSMKPVELETAETQGSHQTIQERMQTLIERTTEDIKACANVCDTYAKKKLIVKVIKATEWDGTFGEFINRFAKRREEFMRALTLHVGAGVDDTNQRTRAIEEKLDIVARFLAEAMSPEHRELAALVKQRGGAKVVMADHVTMRELVKFRPATMVDQADSHNDRGASERISYVEGDELTVVMEDLYNKPEFAIRNNWESFDRKFEMQTRELEEEMRRIVHHEGDRVIKAVTSGPHDRIIDPDIHEIWKEMRWPGHVKARHFVLALRDYYCQQVASKRKSAGDKATVSRIADQDEWALEWISIKRLQAITEAFDDDASGFITVAEVNSFTTSRPKDWSLPHWLAYWAIGWRMTATMYCSRISMLCMVMFAIRSQIHPANRLAVDGYLRSVWKHISTLNSSFAWKAPTEFLQERFKSYVEAEEKRLREALETIKYDIDAMDTLLLVTGPGRIEKNLFPLLWLLLRRDFEIFRLCRTTVIHKAELWDSASTLHWVFAAVDRRYRDLKSLFKQQNLDPGLQFKTFASEALNLWYDHKKFWSIDNLRKIRFGQVEYDDSKESAQNVDSISKYLNYPTVPDDILAIYPPLVQEPITENDTAADEAIRLILGRWNAIAVGLNDEILPMMSFCFHASIDHKKCEASALSPVTGTDYNILGEYTMKDDGTIEYLITQTYPAFLPETYWTVTLTDNGDTLLGKWGYQKDNQPHLVINKRIPPEVLVDRPHPKAFAENRVKALWKFAATAVRNQVRRKLFSWSYFKERRDVRKEFLGLLQKRMDGQLTITDVQRIWELTPRSTYDDLWSFYVRIDRQQRSNPIHFEVGCDHCGKPISGTRVTCIECGSQSTFDFCDKLECMGCTVKTRDDVTSPHLPTHDLVKIRSPIIQYREIGKVLRKAKAGLEWAKSLLEKAETQKKQSDEAEKSSRKQDQESTGPDVGDRKGGEVLTSLPTNDSIPSGRPDTTKSLDLDFANDSEVSLACLKCEAPISQPCFYCIDCPWEWKVFICSECDEKEGGFSHGEHRHLATHNLVRCMEAKEEELKLEGEKAEKRLDALEHKLEGVTVQMSGLTTRMDGLTSQMERIETLLQALSITRAE